MSRAPLLLFVAAAAGLLPACAGGCKSTSRNDMIEDRPSIAVPPSAPMGGGPLSITGALNILVTARCEREETCGRVGDGREHNDRATCERLLLQVHAADVKLLSCKSGIDGGKLAKCAGKLRALGCERDDVPATDACGGAPLCLKE